MHTLANVSVWKKYKREYYHLMREKYFSKIIPSGKNGLNAWEINEGGILTNKYMVWLYSHIIFISTV